LESHTQGYGETVVLSSYLLDTILDEYFTTIDARPGGHVLIRYPNGIEASGEIVDVRSPDRIVFTYGYASGDPIPPGSSRVTIQLEPEDSGTRLHLSHEFADPAVRDHHVQGWRFQLSLFANVVADEANAGPATAVNAWFEAWSIASDEMRQKALSEVAAPGIRFRDRFSLVDGVADLSAHIGASQRFMAGIRLVRKGNIRHCQGTVLSDWVAVASDGQERMSGTNVFVFGAGDRIDAVTGFLNQPAGS
jgi:hypothetical protein